MIVGIGTDIVQIPRIEEIIKKFGRKFAERILSKEELEVYDRKSCRAFLARRFAGKEAVVKALGQGIGRPLGFTDISIVNDEMGKPVVSIKYPAHTARDLKIEISLSDDYPIAVAFVVISS